jgi:hypothetical protein
VYADSVSVQAGPGIFEKKVIIAGKANAAPGMEAQSFMVQAQPATPGGQAGDVVYFWRALPDGEASADVYSYPAQPVIGGGQEVIVQGVVQEGIAQKDVIIYRTQSPQVIWSAPVEVAAPEGNVVIYKVVAAEETGNEVKRFTMQVLPEGGTMQVVPLDPATGMAMPPAPPSVVPQGLPQAVPVPYDVTSPVGGDGWY